jgi:hypothetical protein
MYNDHGIRFRSRNMHNEDEIRFKIEESSFEWETAGFKWKE